MYGMYGAVLFKMGKEEHVDVKYVSDEILTKSLPLDLFVKHRRVLCRS